MVSSDEIKPFFPSYKNFCGKNGFFAHQLTSRFRYILNN